jgi:hypothetical protein
LATKTVAFSVELYSSCVFVSSHVGSSPPLLWPLDLWVLLIVVILPLLPSSNWTIGVTRHPATVMVVHRPPVRGGVVRCVVIPVNNSGALVGEFREADLHQGFRNLELVRLRGVFGQFAIQLCGIIKLAYWTAHSLLLSLPLYTLPCTCGHWTLKYEISFWFNPLPRLR